MNDIYAILVAGGSGSRMNAPLPKQFLSIQGKTLLEHSIDAFIKAMPPIKIILVLPEDFIDSGYEIIQKKYTGASIQVTKGGATRFHSVLNGLSLINANGIVMVHDAVRCLITPNLISSCYREALKNQTAVPAIAVTDSIRIIDDFGNRALNRSMLRVIQTPQTFDISLLKKSFEVEYDPSFTDEASVVEANGFAIHLIEGETTNIKITHPADLIIAEEILQKRTS